jgi:low affinity Fe/Cu permease
MNKIFCFLAVKTSLFAGSPQAFVLAAAVIVVWLVSGPLFNYSTTWQLIINTFTTIMTFLMVFLIQNTQNRYSKAMQLKLDELIRTTKARNLFMDLEDLTDEELTMIDEEFKRAHIKTSPALVKLRNKIAAEHQRRSSLRASAGQTLNTLLSPLPSVRAGLKKHRD